MEEDRHGNRLHYRPGILSTHFICAVHKHYVAACCSLLIYNRLISIAVISFTKTSRDANFTPLLVYCSILQFLR